MENKNYDKKKVFDKGDYIQDTESQMWQYWIKHITWFGYSLALFR